MLRCRQWVWVGMWMAMAPSAWSAALPDLTVTQLEHQPPRLVAGERAEFQVMVRNEGSAPAPESTVLVTVRGQPDSIATPLPPLGPGERILLNVPVTLAHGGTYSVTAQVDAAGSVKEAREDNNSREHHGAAASGGVDLIILGLSLTNECQVVVKVRNIGSTAVPASEWAPDRHAPAGISLFLEGRPAGWTSFREADPERRLASPAGDLEWVSDLTVEGREEVRAVIDDGDQLVETDAQNNDLTRWLDCAGDSEPSSSKVRPHAPLMR